MENFNRRIWQQTPFVQGKRDSMYLFGGSGCQAHDNGCFFFHRHRWPHQQMNCRPRPSSQNNHGKKRKIRWESRDEVCVYVRASARVCACLTIQTSQHTHSSGLASSRERQHCFITTNTGLRKINMKATAQRGLRRGRT